MPAVSNVQPQELDALIVGAEFSGCYLLHRLRKDLGLNVTIFEAGSSVGGTWHWDRYSGARVDCSGSRLPFPIEEAWKNWTWKEKYPSWVELQEYFAPIDQELSFSKDCLFSFEVISAQFLSDKGK
jgi:cation diffusion facilitator CzcD-associated flavoprotein CzcO